MRHVPRKRFGQNFLVDAAVVRRIVDSFGLSPGDNVVEIGPGQGALTGPLLQQLEHLTVVELDRDLVAKLAGRYAPDKLTIHSADALGFDFGALGPSLRVIGNLPYNISTPLLFHLAEFADRLVDITVMLQKEVVDRMVAAPATSDYGRLSVMLQYRFSLEKLFDVPPDAFWPEPKVQSAVVRLVPRSSGELGANDPVVLGEVVAAAFGQRRKMLRNTLAQWIGENELAALSIEPTWRGERLSVADYVRLANACARSATG
ncbi:MAG: 16S rRNA (adenine(1518)-N(6)/adenine(1519)-N(6))-dimethyltransferase RsmA [Rhodocyclaceae bacterium]